ncbi:MAG: DUF401 family protein, partial [Planctomycetota bacterium]
PMVRDLGDQIGIERSRSAAVNFWFRHQWETVWPLFPAVPLIQSMLGISALTLISHNFAIMLSGTLGGVIFLLFFGMPPRSRQRVHHNSLGRNLRDFAHAFWPIALVGVLYVGLSLSPAIGLLPAVILFLVIHKVPLRRWAKIFKSGLAVDFLLLVLGALLFKLNLQAGQAIGSVVEFLTQMRVAGPVLIFLLPMIVAFLTGVTMPTVAITFPFLIPFIGTGPQTNVALQTLAFSGLMCGVLCTPVHLCVALSASYFEAPLTKIIVKLLGPLAFIAAAGILMAVFAG